MRDNKGKIQYIRAAKVKDKLNFRLIKSDEYFNEFPDDKKLNHISFSARFYFIYTIISYLIPLITAIVGHNSVEEGEGEIEGEVEGEAPDNTLYIVSFAFYVIYAFFGIWFKGCAL